MVLAITLGLILGGGAAFGLVKAPSFFKTTPTPTGAPSEEQNAMTPSPTQFVKSAITLDILLPENQSMSDSETVTVSGKTQKKALVALASPTDETVTRADEDGAFSASIKLSEGSNEIVVVASNGDNSVEKRILVNYTTDKL